MTYAMTLDNSWELMTEDEMYDVNGGGSIYTWMVSAPIDIALIASGSYAAFAGVKLLGKFLGQTAAKTLSGAIATVVAAAVSLFVNVSVGALGNLIFGAFWAFTSLGNLVGYALDLVIDGNINGVIYSW